jgi:hypothetical protein
VRRCADVPQEKEARVDDGEKREIRRAFDAAVNMSPKEIEDWLGTEASQNVGFTREGESEAVGHRSGRRILELKRKRKDDLSDDDYAHMREVIGYVRRHSAQGGPQEGRETSRWRYSLMNWGHDPLK